MSGRALVVMLALASMACQDAARALGTGRSQARAHADQLFDALHGRFGPTLRDPRFQELRPKLGRASLFPSRVFDDPTCWTSGSGELRALGLVGRPLPNAYLLSAQAVVPPPAAPGEYRGSLGLQRLAKDEYAWRLREELALGDVRLPQLAATLEGALHAAAAPGAPDRRPALRASLPRAAAVLGQLFTLDELRAFPAPDGAAMLRLTTRLTPDGLRPTRPRYARFLARYLLAITLRLTVQDAAGRKWWDAQLAGGRLVLALRVHDGRLAPLGAPVARMPDQLRLDLDYATKMGPFRVGARGLRADLVLERTLPRYAVRARFRTAPDWQLPFLVGPFLRSSLRRPFAGEGALLAFSLEAAGNGQSIVARELSLAVKESWIVRWLGGLMGAALTEFRRGAEAEGEAYYGEVFQALRADVAAQIGDGQED